MTRATRCLLLLLCVAALAGCSAKADIAAAERAVEEFRGLMAESHYATIYSGSAPELQQTAPEADFEKFLDAVNRKLGKVSSVEENGWNVAMLTTGTIVTLNYKTRYERGDASEQFVYRLQEDKAVLVSYAINSMALAMN